MLGTALVFETKSPHKWGYRVVVGQGVMEVADEEVIGCLGIALQKKLKVFEERLLRRLLIVAMRLSQVVYVALARDEGHNRVEYLCRQAEYWAVGSHGGIHVAAVVGTRDVHELVLSVMGESAEFILSGKGTELTRSRLYK